MVGYIELNANDTLIIEESTWRTKVFRSKCADGIVRHCFSALIFRIIGVGLEEVSPSKQLISFWF